MVDSELLEKITDEHRFIVKYLLEKVSIGELKISYGELSDAIKKKHNVEVNPHTVLPHRIGLISRICHQLGLPMLSVVVVNDLTQLPGEGFYRLYDELHNTHYFGNEYFEKKIRKEVKDEVLNCKEWNKLAEIFDLK